MHVMIDPVGVKGFQGLLFETPVMSLQPYIKFSKVFFSEAISFQGYLQQDSNLHPPLPRLPYSKNQNAPHQIHSMNSLIFGS